MSKLSEPLGKKVVEYLEKYPPLRDDWQYLLAMLWREQIGEQNHSVSCFSFLAKLAHKEVVSPESVRRSWQKVLEENPALRGPKYGKRHKVVEPEFKKELKKLKKVVSPQQNLL
jgi:hypothetical protein